MRYICWACDFWINPRFLPDRHLDAMWTPSTIRHYKCQLLQRPVLLQNLKEKYIITNTCSMYSNDSKAKASELQKKRENTMFVALRERVNIRLYIARKVLNILSCYKH